MIISINQFLVCAEKNSRRIALMEEIQMKGCSKIYILMAMGLAFAGCSSKDTKPEDAAVEASLAQGDDDLPNADEVGSMPEDGSDALNELATGGSPSGAGSDPFADLEDNLSKADESAPSGGSGEMRTYKVRRGDTLMKIAFKLYGDIDRWKDLKNWNQASIQQVSKLEPGTELTYADEGEFTVEKHDQSYLIKTGDTLGGIAKNVYGKTNKWKKLQKYNARLIKNPNRIFAGFTLYYNVTPQEQQEAEQMRNQIGSAAPMESAPPSMEAPAPSAAAPPQVPADIQAPQEPMAAAPGSTTNQ